MRHAPWIALALAPIVLLALPPGPAGARPAWAGEVAPETASEADRETDPGIAITCTLRERAEGADAGTSAGVHAGTFVGTCHVPCRVVSWAIGVHGPIPGRACDFPDREAGIALARRGETSDWRGTMDGKFQEDPKLVAIKAGADGRSGIAELPFGWFALREWRLEGGELTLAIDGGHLLPATEADFAIIRRARELVATPATWNRRDTRECPAGATSWSLFCALIEATNEVEGGVHYRQPALQAVREVIDAVGGDRTGKHRLMDYNNHPDTTLADVQAALRAASDRLATNFR